MDLPFVEALEPARADSPARWRSGDAWLAGGTALFSEPDPQLRRLLDLRALDWAPLTISSDGLEIAATCTIEALAQFSGPSHWSAVPLFGQCAESLYMSWKVAQQATVGGNICLALPAGAMTGLAAGLDALATVWTASGAPRRIPVAELVTGPSATSLAPGELLRAITIAPEALTAEVALRRVSLAPRGRSAALVIGRRELSGTTVLAVTAAVPRPLVLRFPTPPSPGQLTSALADAAPSYYDDVHGDPDWRAHLTALLCEQVRAELTTAG